MNNDAAIAQCSFALLAIGIGFFYQGLKKYKLRGHIQNIPTSKIDSCAMGSFVELCGRVVPNKEPLVSPLFQKKCAFYIIEIYKRTSSRNKKNWTLFKVFYSSPYIFIQDQGKNYAAIDIINANFILGLSKRKHLNFDNTKFKMKNSLKLFLKKNNLIDFNKRSNLLFKTEFKITEKIIYPKELIYSLGTAVNFNDRKKKTKDLTLINRHGQKIPTHFGIDSYEESPAKILLTKNKESGMFKIEQVVISNSSQKRLVKSLLYQICLYLIIGPVSVILSIILFLKIFS